MGKPISTYLDDADFRERISEYAFAEAKKKGIKIKDFGDFSNAFISSMDSDKGKNLLKGWNDNETKDLFESREVKNRLRSQLTDKEFKEAYEDVDNFEVQRSVAKGRSITPKQIKVVKVKKNLKSKSYIRNNKNIPSYNRTYKRWTPKQNRFIAVRKAKKISVKEIIADYNKQFPNDPRPKSSIRTKIYRI